MIQIRLQPRFGLISVKGYVNRVLQREHYHWNSLYLENSIFFFKLKSIIPMQHSVPNKEQWIKWVAQFLSLKHLNRNLFLGLFQSERLKQHMVNIGADQSLSNSAIYKHICLETLQNYTNMIVNLMINLSISPFLNHKWYPLLRYLITISQCCLAHLWL